MTDRFKPGDIVQLKSGGPRMTVVSIRAEGRVICKWFTDDKHEVAGFEPASLMKAPDETKTERGLGFGRDPL